MILNLVINGMEAIASVDDGPRELQIRSCDGAGHITVAVRDSGIGIDPDSEKQLFNAFFTTKSGGMGMGLSICRSIIELHGGRVWASRNAERGATFQFTLPLHEGAEVVTRRQPLQRGAVIVEEPTVLIVEDDKSFCDALQRLFRTVGLRVTVFASAAELLQASLPDVPSCLVLDIRLPGLSGLDIQTELAKATVQIPIIFMTGHGDIPMTVRAMKAGAVDFLTKPFRDQDMLDAVVAAIERDRRRREKEKEMQELRARFGSLSPREREVMVLATAGLMNKQIAAEMGLSEITVKTHRGHAMKKMEARSLADLVRMAEALGIRHETP